MDNKRVYMAIGDGRKFDIKVILDNELVYEGSVENTPEEIKKLKYSKVMGGKVNTYFVHSELQ